MIDQITHLCSFDYLQSFETNGSLPCVNAIHTSIGKSIEISIDDRISIIMWIYQECVAFRFRHEVWFHAVIFITRCFEEINILKDQLKLYATACLCISAKKYEMTIPDLRGHEIICDHSYTRWDIIRIEKKLFSVVNHNVDFPNVMEYIRYITYISNACYEINTLSRVLCLYYFMYDIDVLPSVLATAAHSIANYIINNDCEGYNPFSTDVDTITIVCRRIQYRIRMLHVADTNSELNDIISGTIKRSIPLMNWHETVERICSMEFVVVDESQKIDKIPEKYTPEYYKHQRRSVPTIQLKNIKHLNVIGEGTYGEVFSVEIDNKRYVCKKFIPSKDDEGLSMIFIREVSVLQTLSHENIVSVHFVADQHQSMIIDIMDCDLCEYIYDINSFGCNQQLQHRLMNDLLCGLVYMHSCGVLHRDIKPQNILIKGIWPNIEIKYCDFGGTRGTGIVCLNNTYTNRVCTLWYRAIEILLGSRTYGSSADVWSLMCVFYEIDRRQILFKGGSEVEQLQQIFKIMGTPDDSSWNGVTLLSEYDNNSPKWPNKKNEHFPENSHSHSHSHSNSVLSCIIREGLIMNPYNRPSAKMLLDYFDELMLEN